MAQALGTLDEWVERNEYRLSKARICAEKLIREVKERVESEYV